MRLLLDECVPKGFGALLAPLACDHLTAIGWSGVKNGELLRRIERSGHQALVTTDRNLSFQQSIASTSVFVVVLVARTNRLVDLQPLVEPLKLALPMGQPGQVVVVRSE